MKILVAEDEPSLRQNLRMLLEIEGYEVVDAADGDEALKRAREHKPGLIMTDVMMPRMDGYQLIEVLRQDPDTATIPIIMLTARADRSDVRTGMNLGADDYLTKPYRREEVLDAIKARISRVAHQGQAAQKLHAEAKRLMNFDRLTDLPNRALLQERLGAAIVHAERENLPLAVICIGLSGILTVNDSLGREAGDEILRQAASRLVSRLTSGALAGEHNVVARTAGDRFACSLVDYGDNAVLERVATDLLQFLAKAYEINGRELFLTASAGISVRDREPTDAPGAIAQSEAALNHALQSGSGTFKFFEAAMNQQASRRLLLHSELHKALERDEFRVYYQPQIHIESGSLVGFEALLRWQHHELGFISPAEFIPVAEESGIIVKIGEWVLWTAAAQIKDWLAAGHKDFRIAVNLSVRQLAAGNLTALVKSVLEKTQIPPHMLELEITESVALQSVESTLAIMNECKDLGVKLAMDDFGTGYSSLSYLKRYPLNALKVDQAFVRNITNDEGDAAITRAVVAMAHSFGMSVIAEGVETLEQLDFLKKLKCEDFQGYLFSKPLQATEAAAKFGGFKSPR